MTKNVAPIFLALLVACVSPCLAQTVPLGAGSAFAPSLYFTADSTTGLWQASSGSHTLNFSTNGAEVAAFDQYGNFDLYNSATGYQIDAITVLMFPDTDTTSIAVGDGALAAQSATGSQNTAIGSTALNAVTNGAYNTAVGYEALEKTTSGGSNTAVGVGALGLNTTGSDSTAMGVAALNIATGSPNTAIGFEAGVNITTGTDNTLVGYRAGFDVTGSQNIILGEDLSGAIRAGSSNILVGNSLSNVTNSSSNQLDIGDLIMGAIGSSEVGINTTAYEGTGLTVSGSLYMLGSSSGYVGFAAPASVTTSGVYTLPGAPPSTGGYVLSSTTAGVLSWVAQSGGSSLTSNPDSDASSIAGLTTMAAYANSSGGYNSAYGYDTLNSLTTGTDTTAVGAYALYNTTGSPNDALGFDAGKYITSGTANVALGYEAMQGISATALTGDYNTGVGNSALYDLQGAATQDTALGYEAGEYISSGSNNTAIGYQAMLSMSANPLTGSNNVAVGDTALMSLTGTASDNTAVGFGTLPSLSSGSGNTAVGYEAGVIVTSGTDNVFIGNDTEPGAATDTNEIVIGQGVTGNGSNTTTIGNSSTTGTYINGGVKGVTGGTAAAVGIVGQVKTTNCGAADASATVTFTNASPTVVTWTSSQIVSGVCPVYFTNSGGALPTGVSANTTYYTDPASITTNTFQIATSIGNAIAGTDVNTSSAGSGTQTVTNSLHGVTSTTVYNGAAVSLTAGNWICWGQGFASNSGNTTALRAQVSTSSATLNDTLGGYGSYNTGSWSPTHGYNVNTIPTVFSLSGTTTVYLSVASDFSSGSGYLTGQIVCLRSN